MQRVSGCCQSLAWITAEFLGYRCLVGLHDQFAERAGVFVLARQHVKHRGPQVGIPAKPIEDGCIEQARIQEAGSGAVQPVFAVIAVAEAVRPLQRAVPGVPDGAVGVLDVQVHGDLADVVQQRRVGRASGPGLGLGGLRLRRGAGGQQVRLAQLECVGDDLQAVVQHATRVSMVMALGCGELLDQLGVALQWGEVERSELPPRQRGALPDVFQQLLPTWRRQQRCGRLRPHQPFAGLGGRCRRRRRAGSGRHPFAFEQREHGEPRMSGCSEEPFGLSG